LLKKIVILIIVAYASLVFVLPDASASDITASFFTPADEFCQYGIVISDDRSLPGSQKKSLEVPAHGCSSNFTWGLLIAGTQLFFFRKR